MPRVTADHLEARRAEIVRAALRCFARDGFHATSVRDVVRESGLSAGAVYSYFPSKGELITGVAGEILGSLTAVLGDVAGPVRVEGEGPQGGTGDGGAPGRSPAEDVAAVLRGIYPIAVGGEVDYARIAITAWAEALRDPALADIARTTYGTIRGTLADRVRRWRDAGHLSPDADPEALAQVLLSTILGFITQHAVLGDVDIDRYTAAVTALLPAGQRRDLASYPVHR